MYCTTRDVHGCSAIQFIYRDPKGTSHISQVFEGTWEVCYGMDGLWREFFSDPRDKPYLEDSKWTCVRGCISRWVRGLKVLNWWKPSRWLSTGSDEELDVIKPTYQWIRSYAITKNGKPKSYTSLRRVFTTSRKSQRSDLLYYFSLNHILLENNT